MHSSARLQGRPGLGPRAEADGAPWCHASTESQGGATGTPGQTKKRAASWDPTAAPGAAPARRARARPGVHTVQNNNNKTSCKWGGGRGDEWKILHRLECQSAAYPDATGGFALMKAAARVAPRWPLAASIKACCSSRSSSTPLGRCVLGKARREWYDRYAV